jgi:hypothetical protein
MSQSIIKYEISFSYTVTKVNGVRAREIIDMGNKASVHVEL